MFFSFTLMPAVSFWEAYFEALDSVSDDNSEWHFPWELRQIVKCLSEWAYGKCIAFFCEPCWEGEKVDKGTQERRSEKLLLLEVSASAEELELQEDFWKWPDFFFYS